MAKNITIIILIKKNHVFSWFYSYVQIQTFKILKETAFLLISTLLAFSCIPSTKEETAIPLSHETIELPQTIIGNAYSLQNAISNAHQIHFYDAKDSRLVKTGETIKNYAQYIPDGNTSGYSVINDGNSPKCFTDLAVTNNHVYALYSGRTFKEHQLSYRESEYLFVYDWNGEKIKSCHLDIPISCFCIDEKEKKIYAIANLPDPTLVTFTL